MAGKSGTEFLYDVRLIARNIRKGLITPKDVEKHLKALPDRAGQAAHPELDDHEPGTTNGQPEG